MPSNKQAARISKRTSKVVDDEPPALAGDNNLVATMKQLALGSVLAEVGPALPVLFTSKEEAAAKPAEPKEETTDAGDTTKNDDDASEKDDAGTNEAKAPVQPAGAAVLFDSLIARLPFYNALGLGWPTSGEDAKTGWLAFKSLEVDGGPKRRKKGNDVMERIMLNVERNMVQYMHILLLLMSLRTVLFRSFFACLPWLVGYQVLSLHLPLDLIRARFPQVPPVDFKFRLAATMGIHALMWVFFAFEALYKTYLVEKILLIGIFLAHAYVVSPLLN